MARGEPNTTNTKGTFDWAIYADATLAGLSVLIPVPYADSLTEKFFRQRMLGAIASRRGQTLHPRARDVVNRSQNDIWSRIGGCLLLPVRLLVDLVLRLFRKVLYFLTIKKAVDALNYYWQRAYLLDYMVRQGYLDHAETLEAAVTALKQVLEAEGASPLTRLARELVRSPRRLAQSVRRARQGVEDAEIEQTQQTMEQAWTQYGGYFRRLQEKFEQAYAARQTEGVALLQPSTQVE